MKSSDGGGEARPVVATELDEWPSDWSRDGKYLLYSINDPKSGFDIAYLKIDDKGEREAVRFLHTEFAEKAARFSPDGRFVVYESTESGRNEVYVQAFPGGGGKRQYRAAAATTRAGAGTAKSCITGTKVSFSPCR